MRLSVRPVQSQCSTAPRMMSWRQARPITMQCMTSWHPAYSKINSGYSAPLLIFERCWICDIHLSISDDMTSSYLHHSNHVSLRQPQKPSHLQFCTAHLTTGVISFTYQIKNIFRDWNINTYIIWRHSRGWMQVDVVIINICFVCCLLQDTVFSPPSVGLSVCPSVRPRVRLSVCPSICYQLISGAVGPVTAQLCTQTPWRPILNLCPTFSHIALLQRHHEAVFFQTHFLTLPLKIFVQNSCKPVDSISTVMWSTWNSLFSIMLSDWLRSPFEVCRIAQLWTK